MATDDATYYVQVTGDPGAQFNLVVTRGADFTTQPHTTLATAQDITATQQSGDNKLGGALGSLQNPSGAVLGTTIEGIDFNGSNCGCLPPDTNAAVGNGFVAETVNVEFRVWDTSGNELLDEPLSTLFGQATAGDPYVEYDAAAGHWYVTGIDGADNSKELLAISNDANPTRRLLERLRRPARRFRRPGRLRQVRIQRRRDRDRSQRLRRRPLRCDRRRQGPGHRRHPGLLPVDPIVQLPRLDARPRCTIRSPGGPMWFMASTGDPTYDGTTPNTIRVTEMTNILSNSPIYTDFSVNGEHLRAELRLCRPARSPRLGGDQRRDRRPRSTT